MHPHWRVTLRFGWAALLLLLTPLRLQAAHDLTVAVVPQLTPAITHRNWSPLLEQLGRDTGHRFQLRVYRTFEEFETDLTNGLPDLVFMNPYHQLRAHRSQGYLPLVRDGSTSLTGVLVVPRDSPVKTVKELDGQSIGFPDPNAFAASLYMRAMLHEKEKIRFTPVYYGTHGNVYRHVIAGDVAAGAGANKTLKNDRPATQAALRILYVTPGSPSHPISAHPRVPAADRKAITQALLHLKETEEGRRLLNAVFLPNPVVANFQRDYAPLEKLNLRRYQVTTKLPAR